MTRQKSNPKEKSCYFCEHNISQISFREPRLGDFLTEKGKIVPRKLSGLCARHQRRLARAIKTAKMLALLA